MNEILSYKNMSKMLNDLTFTDYYRRLSLLARTIFKWDNLPNNINEKWIESFLYHYGGCMFFNHPDIGFMIANYKDFGELNHYDEPTFLKPILPNTLSNDKIYEIGKDCVLIHNNDDLIPTSTTMKLYAYKLAQIDRTIDVNIKAQKTPILIKCPEKQRLTLQNVYRQYDENMPVIFGSKDLDLSEVSVLKTDAPIVFDKLEIQKHNVWNECMSFLGINNANQDKRERLVDDEVEANNEQVEMYAHVFLKSRQNDAEMINKLFNTNINPCFRSPEEIARIKEGVENGMW